MGKGDTKPVISLVEVLKKNESTDLIKLHGGTLSAILPVCKQKVTALYSLFDNSDHLLITTPENCTNVEEVYSFLSLFNKKSFVKKNSNKGLFSAGDKVITTSDAINILDKPFPKMVGVVTSSVSSASSHVIVDFPSYSGAFINKKYVCILGSSPDSYFVGAYTPAKQGEQLPRFLLHQIKFENYTLTVRKKRGFD